MFVETFKRDMLVYETYHLVGETSGSNHKISIQGNQNAFPTGR